jgi:hypothetical protein
VTYGGVAAAAISMPEIAELAGVRRPVVTTWRRRYADFPQPVSGDGPRLLFDAGQVVDWLVATGRADRAVIVPDLHLHLLASLAAASTDGRTGLSASTLVGSLTALVCLRHLDDEPLAAASQRSWRAVADLRERAGAVDPDDALLRSEIEALGAGHGWLAGAVDALVEAAWGCRGAYERILAARSRFGVPALDADLVSPAVAALVAGLSGAQEYAEASGTVCVADPAAGAGDLLTAVLDRLDEDVAPRVVAGQAGPPAGPFADPFLARLLRRRLAVRGMPLGDVTVHTGTPVSAVAVDPQVVVTRLPYQPKEHRDGTDPFATVRQLTDALAPGQTVVVLGPADLLVGALPPYRQAWRSRNALLADGRVEAVITLPGGLVPYRPAYQTALWVLRREDLSPWQGRVLLADVSDRPLTPQVADELVWDVATWRRHGHRPDQHLRAYATQVQVADLTQPRTALSTRQPAGLRHLVRPAQAVARAVEVQRDLPYEGDSGLSARREPAAPPRRTVASLIRDGLLVWGRGNRVAAEHIVGDGHHRVIGPPELCGTTVAGTTVAGSRTVDRQVLASHYPRVRFTEPGDVVVTLTPQLGVLLDRDGYAVVEYPARALRITADGRERFTPRVLAALLGALPQLGHGTGRAAGAVRTSARLADLPLPLLPPEEVTRLDGLLAAAEVRRDDARRQIALTDELCRIATTGLADGTLTMAGTPSARNDREH